MKIVQIRTFIPDQEYRCEDDLPFGEYVTTKSIETKINQFLSEYKIDIVHDIKFDIYQGVNEATLIYSIDETKIKLPIK